MAEPILQEQPKSKPSVLNPIFNQPPKPALTAQQIQDQSANPAVGTVRKVPAVLPVDLSYLDKDLYSPDQIKTWNGQNITKLMQLPPETLKAIQLDFDAQRKAEEARPIGNPLTDGPGARDQNLRRIAAKQELLREALLHSSVADNAPKPVAKPAVTPVQAPVAAPKQAPAEAPFVGETMPIQTPPTSTQTAGPLKSIVEKNPGVDWDKIGQIAKDTGMGILGVLQAALAGRTAGLEGRHLDMNDTYIGKQGNIKEAQKEKQSERDWQAQLAQVDRDFTAQQNQINQEFQAAMSQAKTDEEKQAAQLDYQQRLKELDITGKQRMNEIAASKGTAKNPVNLDPRGLNL
jgi:hypothetical protein